MCNRYQPPNSRDITRTWYTKPIVFEPKEVFPRGTAPLIRAGEGGGVECVLGRWQLVPSRWPTLDYPYQTNNARWEDKARTSRTYKPAWERGQRCVIPVDWFNEPCWEGGRHVAWKFAAADGQPMGLAGLWNTWRGPAGDQAVETFTMLTLNADDHPLMSRMHKPDPRLGPDEQDKRMVVVLDHAAQATWLHGSAAEAERVVAQWPADRFSAGPLVSAAGGRPAALDPTTGELF